MKILIADDERLARKELRRLLSTFENTEVVCEVSTFQEVCALLSQRNDIDLAFINLRMPGGDDPLHFIAPFPATCQVIWTTGFNSSTEALQRKGEIVLHKPIRLLDLQNTISRLSRSSSS